MKLTGWKDFFYVVEIGIIPLGILEDRNLTKPCPFFWWVLKQWVSFSLRFGFVLTSSKERGTELEWWRLNQPMNKPKDKCNFKFIFDIFKFILILSYQNYIKILKKIIIGCTAATSPCLCSMFTVFLINIVFTTILKV